MSMRQRDGSETPEVDYDSDTPMPTYEEGECSASSHSTPRSVHTPLGATPVSSFESNRSETASVARAPIAGITAPAARRTLSLTEYQSRQRAQNTTHADVDETTEEPEFVPNYDLIADADRQGFSNEQLYEKFIELREARNKPYSKTAKAMSASWNAFCDLWSKDLYDDQLAKVKSKSDRFSLKALREQVHLECRNLDLPYCYVAVIEATCQLCGGDDMRGTIGDWRRSINYGTHTLGAQTIQLLQRYDSAVLAATRRESGSTSSNPTGARARADRSTRAAPAATVTRTHVRRQEHPLLANAQAPMYHGETSSQTSEHDNIVTNSESGVDYYSYESAACEPRVARSAPQPSGSYRGYQPTALSPDAQSAGQSLEQLRIQVQGISERLNDSVPRIGRLETSTDDRLRRVERACDDLNHMMGNLQTLSRNVDWCVREIGLMQTHLQIRPRKTRAAPAHGAAPTGQQPRQPPSGTA